MKKIIKKIADPAKLPLGYQKIRIRKISVGTVQERLSVWNTKYDHLYERAWSSDKPVSKIIP